VNPIFVGPTTSPLSQALLVVIDIGEHELRVTIEFLDKVLDIGRGTPPMAATTTL
jgi:hypothetical protein